MVIAATIVLFKFLLTHFLKRFKIGTDMQAMTGYFQKMITRFVRLKLFFLLNTTIQKKSIIIKYSIYAPKKITS